MSLPNPYLQTYLQREEQVPTTILVLIPASSSEQGAWEVGSWLASGEGKISRRNCRATKLEHPLKECERTQLPHVLGPLDSPFTHTALVQHIWLLSLPLWCGGKGGPQFVVSVGATV